QRIIIDPGIGFGKTVEDNLALLRNVSFFKNLKFRLLYGISRKSFMSKLLNKTNDQLLPATLAIDAYLIMSKVDIIRVHDVAEHKDVLGVLSQLINIQEEDLEIEIPE